MRKLVRIITLLSFFYVEYFFSQTTTLYVTKSGNDVVLTFSGTTGPWRVVRSESKMFDYNNVLLDSSNSAGTYTDTGTAGDWRFYFYDVSDIPSGEIPADDDQPIEDIVKLTSLVLDYGFDGNTITINGSGFDPNPTSNQVFFGPLLAVVTGGTATSLTVTVPPNVTSCNVSVQKGSVVSNSLPFWAVLESNVSGTPFQDISSLCFNDRTGTTAYKHLFITDRGTNGITSDRLWEVQDNYTLIQRGGTWNEMKGLPMDASGNMYFANTINLTTNVGNVRKYDPVTLTHALWHHARLVSETDNVQVIGIQMRSDGKGYAYNLSTGTWRIIDTVANTVFTYGSGAWFADDLMGSAIDSTDNLYFTSGGSVIKMNRVDVGPPYNPTITTVTSAFVQGSGMDIDETTGNKLLLVADRGNGSAGNGKVYLLNADSGNMDLITSNLTNPRATAFGEDKITGEKYYYMAEANRVLRMPEPTIEIDPVLKSDNIPCLISKKGAGDSYPTPLQTVDAKIDIKFEVKGKISSPVTVYAGLLDPKDPSPYVTGAEKDNKDPNINGNSGTFQNYITPSSITVDPSNPKGTFTLTITNRFAGDNYVVNLFLQSPPDPTKNANAKTGVITAWKRAYIEKDKMFRRGGVLFEDYLTGSCAPNCDKIKLFDGTNVANGDSIVVFDETNTAESGGETRTVIADPVYNVSGYWIVQLDSPLTKNYYASTNDGLNPPKPIFGNGRSAGAGVIGSGFYEASVGTIKQAYNDAFVEVKVPPDGRGAVPYLPQSWFDAALTPERARFSQIWFAHFLNGGGTPPLAQPHNHFHIIGASNMTNTAGKTNSDYDYSYIFVGGIEILPGTPTEITNMIMDTTDHEIGHQFKVNICSSGEHDSRNAWCYTSNNCGLGGGPSELCVMSGASLPNADAKDGVSRFCSEDLLSGDPNCSEPPTPKAGAIRTDEDPL